MKTYIWMVLIIVGILLVGCEQKIVVVNGNDSRQPLEFELNTVQDAHCGMILDRLKNAAQIVAPDGRTWFFHDIGGIALWLKDKAFKNEAVIWAYTNDTHRWIDATKAWYSLTDDTPMHYGFGAYEKKADEEWIDYETMRLRMMRGENLTNPYIRKKLLKE